MKKKAKKRTTTKRPAKRVLIKHADVSDTYLAAYLASRLEGVGLEILADLAQLQASVNEIKKRLFSPIFTGNEAIELAAKALSQQDKDKIAKSLNDRKAEYVVDLLKEDPS